MDQEEPRYLRIGDAARYLGVSPSTLRNWERAGKIATHRHPVNNYRLFRRPDLDALLHQIEASRRNGAAGREPNQEGHAAVGLERNR